MTTKSNGTDAIGKPIDRVDGRLKVTGAAQYSAEWPMDNLHYGVVIQSTIPKGKITGIDSREAESIPGVKAVFSFFKNQPSLSKKGKQKAENLFLLQDNVVRYAGQIIALVVADTFEVAKHAASLVDIKYAPESFNSDLDARLNRSVAPGGQEDSERGKVDKALAGSAVKVEATYSTPTESHNPMEPFATTAMWNGDRLTLYDSTQAVHKTCQTMAEILDLPQEKVRVISHFIGGGFGCKLTAWAQVPLAALAARKLGRPVKVVLDRHQMFGPVGFRPATVQKVSLGASTDGQLTAIKHECINETATFKDFVESAAEPARVIYKCPNVKSSHRIVKLDIGQPTWMRAPGHATGSFALECALDELAYKLDMDPLHLRLLNWADKDPDSELPWSSNALRDCYRLGAEKFGWSNRQSKPRAMRDGRMLIGYGMATALHSVWRNPASALVILNKDGTAIVQCGSQDIGTGTYTVMTQVAAEKLSLPVEKVSCELGDSTFPEAPMSGGSTTSGSVGNAVAQACSAALTKLFKTASADSNSPLKGADPGQMVADNGTVSLKDKPEINESFSAIVSRTPKGVLEAMVNAKVGDEEKNYSMSTFGAQFAEVRVDPDLGRIHVSRFAGAYDAGRILNHKTARSQVLGGITFGIGMALMEHTWMDHNLGRIVNSDLAEYHVPVHPDIGSIDVHFIEPEDPQVNVIGVKGIGELGITGVAAAIANAVYNATGIRVRDLPITLDKIMV